MAHPMSLEAASAAEAREVMALLEGNITPVTASSVQAPNSSAFPHSPVRSMLDVDAIPTRRTTQPPVRSMLDIDGPSLESRTAIRSAQVSPTEGNHRSLITKSSQPRSSSFSESGNRHAGSSTRTEKTKDYQFSQFLQTKSGTPGAPKRKGLFTSSKKIIKGDTGSFGGRDSGRHNSLPGTGMSSTAKSRSPHNRLGQRSNSPSVDQLPYTLTDGRPLDVNNAYRRLTDSNLAFSGGSLAKLTEQSRQRRTNSGDAFPEKVGRLEKDYLSIDGEDALQDSSDDDASSSGDERQQRGRKGKSSEKEDKESTLGMGQAKGPRTARSLMAAVEEERKETAAQQAAYKVQSMLDIDGPPATSPTAAKTKSTKDHVHPHTNYDRIDTEEHRNDAQQAQNLTIKKTSIESTPLANRCIRTIIRGNFSQMEQEARDGDRRVRKYLVATDLSSEAEYAMEWTFGTVLRDGDTLLCISCVDEEQGILSGEATPGEERSLLEQTSARIPILTPLLRPTTDPTIVDRHFSLESRSARGSPDRREASKAEQERVRAVEEITLMVERLLRQTKLQIKVMIEVIHCKTPRSLIIDVIDLIEPTLVILGSRGRSALKGTILGSFSNFLVSKSSAPVMVARKRLYTKTQLRNPPVLANNLSTHNKSKLASAKVDEWLPKNA